MKQIKGALALIAAAFIITNVAQAQVFVPDIDTVERGKSEYKLCLQQLQPLTNDYSRCAGQLIERGVLSPVFRNFLIEQWVFNTELLDFPDDLENARILVDACFNFKAYVGLHRKACLSGI